MFAKSLLRKVTHIQPQVPFRVAPFLSLTLAFQVPETCRSDDPVSFQAREVVAEGSLASLSATFCGMSTPACHRPALKGNTLAFLNDRALSDVVTARQLLGARRHTLMTGYIHLLVYIRTQGLEPNTLKQSHE